MLISEYSITLECGWIICVSEVWPYSAGMRMMPQQAASSPQSASGGTDSSRMGQRTATLPTPASPSFLLSRTDRRQPRPCSVAME